MRLPTGPLKTIQVSSARLHLGKPPFVIDCEGQRYYAERIYGEWTFEFVSGELGPMRTAWFQTTGWLELEGMDRQGFVA